jgi:probable HAF family extracellular repeat protein
LDYDVAWHNGKPSYALTTGITGTIDNVAINDTGQSVGSFEGSNNQRAYTYAFEVQAGTIVDLNSELAGSSADLVIANSINNKGEIVGLAIYQGSYWPYELFPPG